MKPVGGAGKAERTVRPEQVPWIREQVLRGWVPRIDVGKLRRLKERRGRLKIYLIHDPADEEHAREVAERLREEGIEPVVAADVRRGWWGPEDGEDLANVARAIRDSDAVLLVPPRKVALMDVASGEIEVCEVDWGDWDIGI